jgi:hypothetical protein
MLLNTSNLIDQVLMVVLYENESCLTLKDEKGGLFSGDIFEVF